MGMYNRNVYRDAVMRNFSDFSLERYILIDDDSMTYEEKDLFVKNINESLWLAIQEVNARIQNRILPYVIVRRVIKEEDKLRIVINPLEKDFVPGEMPELQDFDPKNASHVINFKLLSPQKRITNLSGSFIATRMMVDKSDQIAAAVDIFLDIAMFNSYSFLSSMSLNERKTINELKLKLFFENGLSSYFYVDLKNPPLYISFSFCAREEYDSINYDLYVSIWNSFISKFFRNKNHVELSPCEQLKYHRDRGALKKDYFESSYWKQYDKGGYLLLRTNRDPGDAARREMLANYFNIPTFRVNEEKIAPLSDYFLPVVHSHMQDLYISAFKIVV